MNGDNMEKLLKNSILMLIGNFASKLLVFFLVPFYTSILSTEEYAISDLLVTTINLLYPIFSLMIETAVLRFCLDKKEDHGQVISTGLWLEIMGFAVFTMLSMVIIPHTGLSSYTGYFFLYYILYCVYMLLMNFAKGRNNVGVYAFAGVCNTIVLVACNILFLAKFKMGIHGYLLSMIIGYAITSFFLLIGTKAYRFITFPWKLNLDISKRMVRYARPLIPNSLSWWVSNSSDRYVMRIFRSANELGVYSVAYKIPSIMAMISNIMMSAWEISAVDDFGTEKNRLFFSKMYGNYLEVQVICCTCIMLLIKPIAFVLFQKDFYAAWIFVPALLFAGVFSTLSAFLGTIFTAAKQTNSIFITTMLGAGANIILNFLLIPSFGGQGAAIATAISYATIFVARLVGSRKIMKLSINYSETVLKLILLGGLAISTCIDTRISIVIGLIILFVERTYVRGIVGSLVEKVQRTRSTKETDYQ